MTVYRSPDQAVELREPASIDGGELLPGFILPLTRLFERYGKRRSKGKKNGK